MTQTHLANRSSVPLAPQLDFILVDGSSSMQPLWWPTLDALDTFCTSLRAHSINSHLLCAVFDKVDVLQIQRDCLLRDAPSFSTSPLLAYWTATPLYDAINALGRALRDLNPASASIVIATDGDENASEYTDAAQAKAIINWMRAKGWSVTFIGCDWNNSHQARSLGVDESNAIGVSRANLSSAARSLADKRVRNIHTGEPITFTDSERQQFGGYLT